MFRGGIYFYDLKEAAHCQITNKIDKDVVGETYQATDSKLGGNVAIKDSTGGVCQGR